MAWDRFKRVSSIAALAVGVSAFSAFAECSDEDIQGVWTMPSMSAGGPFYCVFNVGVDGDVMTNTGQCVEWGATGADYKSQGTPTGGHFEVTADCNVTGNISFPASVGTNTRTVLSAQMTQDHQTIHGLIFNGVNPSEASADFYQFTAVRVSPAPRPTKAQDLVVVDSHPNGSQVVGKVLDYQFDRFGASPYLSIVLDMSNYPNSSIVGIIAVEPMRLGADANNTFVEHKDIFYSTIDCTGQAYATVTPTELNNKFSISLVAAIFPDGTRIYHPTSTDPLPPSIVVSRLGAHGCVGAGISQDVIPVELFDSNIYANLPSALPR